MTDVAAPSRTGRRLGWPAAGLAAVGGVAGQLYGLYLASGPPVTLAFPYADKLEHAVGFATPVFFTLLAVALYRLREVPRALTTAVVALFAAHGVASEIIQHTRFAARTGDPLDVCADWLGVLAGWGAYRLVAARWLPGAYE